jgi:hypothetical protein
MNEKIRELANQAHEYALGMYDTRIATEGQSNVLFYQIRDDKFAELIVRECAAEADRQTIYCRGIPWGRWIKEHFGVEQ